MASTAIIAAAGAGAMVGLACMIAIDTAKPRQHVVTVRTQSVRLAPRIDLASKVDLTPKVDLAPSVDRLAFAPSDAFSDTPELRASFAPEGEPVEADPDQPPGETANWETAALPWETDAKSTPIARAVHRDLTDHDDLPARKRPYSRSIEKRLAEISPGATARLKKKFEEAKVAWPPSDIALIGIKDEKVLELHAHAKGQPWQLIHRYRVLAASGGMGPKLRQGDKQVPEGIYQIAWLNPNSAYHVSLRVSYPNAFDRKMAKKDGRANLGGDIMIHGKNLSAGCLAMGDEAVEEIFTVAAETGLAKVRVIIAPTDLRTKGVPAPKPGQPEWVPKLYTEIASAMSAYEAVNPIATGSTTNIASSFMSFFAK